MQGFETLILWLPGRNIFENSFLEMDLRQSASICIGENLYCMFVLQPVIYVGNKPLTEVEKNIYLESASSIRAKNLPLVYPYYEKIYASLDERYKSYEKIKFLILNDIFDKETRRVYRDTGHLLDLGSEIIAKRIAGEINLEQK